MAPVLRVLRTCGLIFYLIFTVCSEDVSVTSPWIVKLEVDRKHCLDLMCKYLLHVRGGPYLGHYSWRLTATEGPKGSECGELYPNYEIKEIESKEWDARLEITVPNMDGKLFFCLRYPVKKNNPMGDKYVHQGAEMFLNIRKDLATVEGKLFPKEITSGNEISLEETQKAELLDTNRKWVDLSHDTDVNYLHNAPRTTREERKDVEVKINDIYLPLDEIYGNSIQDPQRNYWLDSKKVDRVKSRTKREILHGANKESDDQDLDKLEELKMGNDEVIGPFDDKLDDARVKTDDPTMPRSGRQAGQKFEDFSTVRADRVPIVIEGLRIEDSDKEPKIIEDGIPSVLADTKFTLRVFGQGLTQRTVIAFTHDPMEYGQPCKFLVKGEYMVKENTLKSNTALFDITAPAPITGSKLFICAKNLRFGVTDPNKDEEKYLHMGIESWRIFATHNKLLPLWVSLTLILVCLMFSALFSGLNLGLMSLDRTELKIISNTGTEQERKYARAIMPVRDHGNYLLCSILLGNVAVNSTFTILLDELTSGLFAVIFSTLAIVLLGEITPQAICSRHGLMVGAKSIMITKAVMGLTAPLAFPVSKLLDYFLGEEIGSVYNRERLKELVKVTTDVNDLDKDEVNIISGALELRKKTVSDVMTKLEDAFMLPITSILDFETMSEIIKSGYSRIPVYEGSRGNIVTVLFIKDLAFVDPDDNTPLKTLCQYYQNPCNFVFEDVTLDVMFKQFKEGHKGHMAFVHRINNEGEGDPFYETIGLVTLEDVIEEMIQAEIVDETDVFMDNRTKRRRNRPQNKLQDFAAFAERHENQRIHISPQLTLATFQFLSTSVDAFRPDTVSETVLRRLLKQDVIQHIKVKNKTKRDPCTYVFQQGKPVDYFVLILEGRVEVTVGRENLVFEAGPFTYFGVQALTQNIGVAESPTPSAMGSLQNINMDSMLRHTFVPDYSVRAITELYYLTVKRSLYLAAKRATLMEKGALSKGATNEQFDTEVDKLNPKKNVIELMQVTKYVTSDNICDKRLTNNQTGKHLNKSNEFHPSVNYASQSMANISAIGECWPNATKSVSNLLDGSAQSANDEVSSASTDLMNNLDANNCAECLRNNFWTKTVADASCKDYNDSELGSKKKRTTFRTDSSLLIIHNLSSSSDNKIDEKSIREIERKQNNTTNSNSNELSDKTISKNLNMNDLCNRQSHSSDESNDDSDKSKLGSCITSRHLIGSKQRGSSDECGNLKNSFCTGREETRRRETDSLVLMQLSKIIRILEKKDLT